MASIPAPQVKRWKPFVQRRWIAGRPPGPHATAEARTTTASATASQRGQPGGQPVVPCSGASGADGRGQASRTRRHEHAAAAGDQAGDEARRPVGEDHRVPAPRARRRRGRPGTPAGSAPGGRRPWPTSRGRRCRPGPGTRAPPTSVATSTRSGSSRVIVAVPATSASAGKGRSGSSTTSRSRAGGPQPPERRGRLGLVGRVDRAAHQAGPGQGPGVAQDRAPCPPARPGRAAPRRAGGP